MVDNLSRLFGKIGTPNLLAIGIAIIVVWLLISGIRKGLKRGDRDKDSEENENRDDEPDPDSKM